MDHLPYPNGPCIPPIEIPFYDRFKYDGMGLKGFQERQNLINPEDGYWIGIDEPVDMAAFLQAWLWFGLLESFLGTPLETDEFISNNSLGGTSLLSSFLITEKMKALASRVGLMSEEEKRADMFRRQSALDLGLRFSDDFDLSTWVQGDEVKLVLLSVKVLLDSLYRVQIEFQLTPNQLHWNEIRETPSSPRTTWRHSLDILVKRFQQAGWCMHQFHQYLSNPREYTYLTLYYFSSIRRIEVCGLSHSMCSRDECKIDNIDDKTYHPVHTAECNDALRKTYCQSMEIDYKQVKAVLQSGGIPIVEISMRKNGEIILRIDRVKEGIKYSAISHVWSHGLGNKDVNAMFPCQLRSIYQSIQTSRSLRRDVNHMDETIGREVRKNHSGDRVTSHTSNLLARFQKIYVWIDTLCVPRGFKQEAINRMARTYGGARDILIVDGELRGLNRYELSEAEVLARVYFSTWMRRCWTLQEGVLAPHWFVLFKDGPSYVTALYTQRSKDIEKLRKTTDFARFNHQALRSRMVRIGHYTIERDWRFHSIWNDIRQRSTSVESVRDIIVGSLLNLSAFQLQKMKTHEERFQAILRSQERIPLGLLVLPGPRMGDNDGSPTLNKASWTPANIPKEEALNSWPIVDFNGKDIKIELSPTSPIKGLILPKEATSAAQVVLVETDGTPKFWIHPREKTGVDICRRAPLGNTIILLSSVERKPYMDSGGSKLLGARLSIREQKDGVIYTSFICPVEIWTADPERVSVWAERPSTDDPKYSPCVAAHAYGLMKIECGSENWPILRNCRHNREDILTDGLYPSEYAPWLIGTLLVGLVSIVLMLAIPAALPISIHYARIIWATLSSLCAVCVVGVVIAYIYLSGKEKQKYREWVSSFEEGSG